MTVITDGPDRRAWQELGRRLPRPRAILAVSAHWETHGHTHVTAERFPRTIHDFRNFPQELYDMRYPAPGSPGLVARIAALLGAERVARDTNWGFDHGAWGVVLPMYPEADIPMVAMSLDRSLSAREHFAFGRALAPLRDEGVLIVASGNIIHNLAVWRQRPETQPDWIAEFQARSNAAILSGDDEALIAFAPDDHAAGLAINSAEHYLPLLYALGARRPEDGTALFNDRPAGPVSMTSVLIGDTNLLSGIS